MSVTATRGCWRRRARVAGAVEQLDRDAGEAGLAGILDAVAVLVQPDAVADGAERLARGLDGDQVVLDLTGAGETRRAVATLAARRGDAEARTGLARGGAERTEADRVAAGSQHEVARRSARRRRKSPLPLKSIQALSTLPAAEERRRRWLALPGTRVPGKVTPSSSSGPSEVVARGRRVRLAVGLGVDQRAQEGDAVDDVARTIVASRSVAADYARIRQVAEVDAAGRLVGRSTM